MAHSATDRFGPPRLQGRYFESQPGIVRTHRELRDSSSAVREVGDFDFNSRQSVLKARIWLPAAQD
jgi:hypothetical protein